MQPHPFPAEARTSLDSKTDKVRSSLVSRNVTISGHRTSVRLEPEMWSGLNEICRRERLNLHDTCSKVAQDKGETTSLTAAIRVYVMTYYRAASTDDGHLKAGHGLIGGMHGRDALRDRYSDGRNGDNRGEGRSLGSNGHSRPPLRNVSAMPASGALSTRDIASSNMSSDMSAGGSVSTAASPQPRPAVPFMIGMPRQTNGMR